MSATFLIFDGVARGVVVGQVLYGFTTDPQYNQAREASPDVPELHLGEAHDLRQFWDRLNAASHIAEGG
jgi:hypothetical protein